MNMYSNIYRLCVNNIMFRKFYLYPLKQNVNIYKSLFYILDEQINDKTYEICGNISILI